MTLRHPYRLLTAILVTATIWIGSSYLFMSHVPFDGFPQFVLAVLAGLVYTSVMLLFVLYTLMAFDEHREGAANSH